MESIHERGARSEGPFVVVDCSAIPSTLLESELFGHERGAFTGAGAQRIGALEAANGGTLFLDEVGELPIDLQPKLLRVLESRRVKRVGAHAYLPFNVRVIAATNRDLRDEVAARRFRADLYYRLAVVEIQLPPLRERLEDIPILVEHLLSSRHGVVPAFIQSRQFLESLQRYEWPGNVRELRNYLERCVTLNEAAPLGAGARSERDTESTAARAPLEIDPDRPYRKQRDEWLREFEVRYLECLIAKHGGNITAAARSAELDRAYLYRLLWRNQMR
nr:Sigma54 specific transcriptional regulator, Fis family [Sandaracinus sp.]